ncbi:MAG: hypothetical protein V3V81_07440 [Candidatus Bathyarchaeia archaeon]
MAHEGGRPKITLNDLPKDWKKDMLELAAKGGTDVEFRVHCLGGICHETWTRLIKEEAKFSETVIKARDLCEAWWVGKPRTNLDNKEFNTTLFAKFMSNKFNWRDKQDVTSDDKAITMVITPGESNL